MSAIMAKETLEIAVIFLLTRNFKEDYGYETTFNVYDDELAFHDEIGRDMVVDPELAALVWELERLQQQQHTSTKSSREEAERARGRRAFETLRPRGRECLRSNIAVKSRFYLVSWTPPVGEVGGDEEDKEFGIRQIWNDADEEFGISLQRHGADEDGVMEKTNQRHGADEDGVMEKTNRAQINWSQDFG
ncbi:hypothetical protein Cni_G19238 [Canna indica]|uniref:Uncharacterized protein n=1 Tax=Canna indica TaxID=4628 RepID=A0AAQ3KR37_9LILI|nr:hypothetical protein Cni_G19238 [Canna indica]